MENSKEEWKHIEKELPDHNCDVVVFLIHTYLDAYQQFEIKAKYNNKKKEFKIWDYKLNNSNDFSNVEHKIMCYCPTDVVYKITKWRYIDKSENFTDKSV